MRWSRETWKELSSQICLIGPTDPTDRKRGVEDEAPFIHPPEVLITTRRTGLQLGLAAVTESNYGDLTVRLKQKRSRSVQEVMNDVRRRVKEAVPQLDAEYTQILQDNINDLSNSPEPIQIKLFSPDISLLNDLGPKVQAAISAIPGIVDTQNGVDNTLSGPATKFQIDSAIASRLEFHGLDYGDRDRSQKWHSAA